MKSLLKFTLLSALIIGGRLAKQPAPAAVAATPDTPAPTDSSLVLVHHVLPASPVKPGAPAAPPQASGNGLLAELF